MRLPTDWNKLKIFYAAAKAGSFTQAAAKLQMSQSSISRQVTNLELELGLLLFQRHARGLVLSEQGEELFNAVETIIEKLEQTYSSLSGSRSKLSGSLRVTTTLGLGQFWLPNRLTEFASLYPDIQLQLYLDDEELDLISRDADCAIRLHQPRQQDIIAKKLFDIPLHIYAGKGYVAKYGSPTSLADLDNHKLLCYGAPVPYFLESLNSLKLAGRSNNKPRNSNIEINNLGALRTLALQNLGLVVLPDYLANEEPSLVKVLEDKSDLPAFSVYFCYPIAIKKSARIQAFKEFLIHQADNRLH